MPNTDLYALTADERAVIEEVLRRFYLDAEFSAQVKVAAALVDRDLNDRTGRWLTSDEASLVRMGAAVALVLSERPEAHG